MSCTTSDSSVDLDAPGEHVTLLRDGVEAIPAMLKAIRAARREVVLEMYWLDSSVVGVAVTRALAERARAGVAVYVLYDAIGSLGADGDLFDDLIAAGAKVIQYNPIAPWRRRFRLGRVSRRDHRKMLVVDDRVAFVGGLNLGLPWLCVEEGGGGWRDDVAVVVGPTAARVRALFFETWSAQGGACPSNLRVFSSRERAEAAREELGVSTMSRAHPRVAVLGHDAWGARWAIRRAYLSRIRNAERRVLIANSYFIPDMRVKRALKFAAQRGVEVRVLVPRISDVPAVKYATEWLYTGLMEAGIHVHEFTRGILHAKTLLVDDWATTGSYNLDYRSFRYNLEANLASTDAAFVAAVEASMRSDLAERSEEVDLAAWRRRPLFDKARSWVFYLARKTL
jgi:cardiolipin synthase A/B